MIGGDGTHPPVGIDREDFRPIGVKAEAGICGKHDASAPQGNVFATGFRVGREHCVCRGVKLQ